MVMLDEAGERLAVVQMNSELRHAQLELLSAQCATDRIRLRYSVETVARAAKRDVLRKAWASASALYEYYNAVCQQAASIDGTPKAGELPLGETEIQELIDHVARYIHEQRAHFRGISAPLNGSHRAAMTLFFSVPLLTQVRIVRIGRQPVPPPFYAEAKALGIANLPELAHSASTTFADVVVFHERIDDRALFHALVHAVQIQVLGVERYAERFVRAFLKTRSHGNVPLEAHAVQLESGFAASPESAFSVEEKVRLWSNQGRY